MNDEETLCKLAEGTKKRIDEIGPDRVTIFTTAHLPPTLEKAWLQYVRDFDTAHPGCHFEIALEGPEQTLPEIVEALRLNPALDFHQVFKRKTE